MKRNLIIAVIFLIVEIGAFLALIITQNMGMIALPLVEMAWSLVMLGLFTFITLVYMLGIPRRIAFQKAVLIGDARRAPRAAQPDPALALAPGETITLTRWRTSWGNFAMYGSSVMPLYLSLLTVLQSSTPEVAVGAKFLFGLSFVIAVMIMGIAINSSRVVITADDVGLTIQHRLTRKCIAWGDIKGFTMELTSETVSFAQSYTLFMANTSYSFKFSESLPSLMQRKRQLERVKGDPLLYLHQAQRVIATIAARTGQPQRIMPLRKWSNPILRLSQLGFGGASTLPLAAPTLQAGTFIPDERYLRSGKLILCPRLPWGKISVISCVSALLMTIATYFMEELPWLIYWTRDFQSPYTARIILFRLDYDWNTGFLLAVIAITIFLGSLFMLFGWLTARSLRPSIIASETGIARATIFIPWHAIHAWAIVRNPAKPGSATYAVFTDAPLIWRENNSYKLAERGVMGDRQAAFQDRAAQLHALIAQKTGLPLREMEA